MQHLENEAKATPAKGTPLDAFIQELIASDFFLLRGTLAADATWSTWCISLSGKFITRRRLAPGAGPEGPPALVTTAHMYD
jgi:hypothetical protein